MSAKIKKNSTGEKKKEKKTENPLSPKKIKTEEDEVTEEELEEEIMFMDLLEENQEQLMLTEALEQENSGAHPVMVSIYVYL